MAINGVRRCSVKPEEGRNCLVTKSNTKGQGDAYKKAMNSMDTALFNTVEETSAVHVDPIFFPGVTERYFAPELWVWQWCSCGTIKPVVAMGWNNFWNYNIYIRISWNNPRIIVKGFYCEHDSLDTVYWRLMSCLMTVDDVQWCSMMFHWFNMI